MIMKRRYYVKNKSFLRNFCILMVILLAITFCVTGAVYQMSFRTLQQEITGINEVAASELAERLEEAILKANEIAIDSALDGAVQLYFTYENPEYLMENYYQYLAKKLSVSELPYIDSVVLYAPQHERTYDSRWGHYSHAGGTMPEEFSWMKDFEGKEDVSQIYTRSDSDGWPYYITLTRHWNSKTTEGIVFVNINLDKLYDYLLGNRETTTQLYILDGEQRVILKENKKELYESPNEIRNLDSFRMDESFSKIEVSDVETHTYVQQYLEEYELTFIVVTSVGDYFIRLAQVQKHFVFALCVAVAIATILACVYSIKLIKPQEESTKLREELDQRTEVLKDTQLLALQTQINPHFMFNTLNVACLMVENDCGDGHPVTQLLVGLSDILRYSLSKSKTACIKEEIEYVEKYLSIMKYRYGDFEIAIDMEEKLRDYTIPKLVLQPLVENAIQHGLVPCLGTRQGKVEVSAKEIEYTYEGGKCLTSVCIDIKDNGLGMDEEQLNKIRSSIGNHYHMPEEHIGVFNVAQRIYLFFHEEQKVTIDSTFGKGTHIQLVFPVKK